MKRFRFHILAVPALLTVASAGMAQTSAYSSNALTDVNAPDSTSLYPEEIRRARLLRESKIIFMNGDSSARPGRDSVESLLAQFYVDQFRNSQAPEAPYFTFMSKDANLAMGIGAVIVLDAWADWNGMINGPKFVTYDIAIPKTPEARKDLGATASGSKIFFSILGRHTPIGTYQAYIEGGFNGYGNSGFKLKKAWMQIGDWTAGLATSTFTDPAAEPSTLDPAGSNGKMDRSNVLVRYMHTWKNRWSVAGSVEFPSSQPQEQEGLTAKVKDYVPDVAALGQYQWNRGMSHVRLAGIFRSMAYRDLVAQRNKSAIGWGLQLSTVVRAGRLLTLYGMGSYGKGVASYTGDLSNGDYDLLARPGHSGELYAPTTLSGTVGAKIQILPALSSTFCLATLRTLADDQTHDATYKYGQYLAINAVYQITSRLHAGVEYLAGKRMNFNGQHANVNRAQAIFVASF